MSTGLSWVDPSDTEGPTQSVKLHLNEKTDTFVCAFVQLRLSGASILCGDGLTERDVQ